jgi:DNA replication protein DnaC
MSSNGKINPAGKLQEEFTQSCHYLGMKHLAEQYRGMVEKAGKENPGYYEFIRDIVQAEAAAKRQRHVDYLVKKSKLPEPLKMLEGFDFDFQPKLDRRLVMDLATLDFMGQNASVLFVGYNGTGKSHLAQSLALKACRQEYRTYYTTLSGLITDLNAGVFENTLEKRIRKYINPELLVIDEMGHDRLELQVTKEAHLLFKVIDQRYKDNKSLIFTSNVEEEDWSEFLGDPVTTRAILDRIFHHSIIVKINGPSYRQYQGELLQKKYGKNKETTENKKEAE